MVLAKRETIIMDVLKLSVSEKDVVKVVYQETVIGLYKFDKMLPHTKKACALKLNLDIYI